MGKVHILVIDEGTTGTRALVFNEKAEILSQAYSEFTQFTPSTDKVEHDPVEIWDTTMAMIQETLDKAKLKPADITAIGITNQRATSVVWDKATGEPIYRAIVWQDMRTGDLVDEIRATEWSEKAHQGTGWSVAQVYSSLMLKWIFTHVPEAKVLSAQGRLAFGTIDSWLIWKLTGGKEHAISYSNASVTGSLNLHTLNWYDEWLTWLGIPVSIFPELKDDSGYFGETDPKIFGERVPILAAIADQHAALFAQGCLTPGTVKCTHGTGTFLDVNIGDKPVISKYGLNSIIAWRIKGHTTFGLEGYANVTGSAIQWLRDGLGIINKSAETEAIATSVPSSEGVYFVLGHTGIGAPYWDAFARGLIIGITRGTKRAHIVRATLEAIVYHTKDILEAMYKESGVKITSVKVDGGAAANNFLLQFQADMLDAEVERPLSLEATSLGAAFLAGLASGVWKSTEEISNFRKVDRIFYPKIDPKERDRLYDDWKRAIERSLGWAKH